jgi:hypothetical protein
MVSMRLVVIRGQRNKGVNGRVGCACIKGILLVAKLQVCHHCWIVELSKLCLSLLGLIGSRSSQALGGAWDKRGRGVQFKHSPYYVLVFISFRPKGQVWHESNLALGDFFIFFIRLKVFSSIIWMWHFPSIFPFDQ